MRELDGWWPYKYKSGFMKEVDGVTVGAYDSKHKRRRDQEINDEDLKRRAMVRVHARVAPRLTSRAIISTAFALVAIGAAGVLAVLLVASVPVELAYLAWAVSGAGIGFGYVMNKMMQNLAGDPRTIGLIDAVRRSM